MIAYVDRMLSGNMKNDKEGEPGNSSLESLQNGNHKSILIGIELKDFKKDVQK